MYLLIRNRSIADPNMVVLTSWSCCYIVKLLFTRFAGKLVRCFFLKKKKRWSGQIWRARRAATLFSTDPRPPHLTWLRGDFASHFRHGKRARAAPDADATSASTTPPRPGTLHPGAPEARNQHGTHVHRPHARTHAHLPALSVNPSPPR